MTNNRQSDINLAKRTAENTLDAVVSTIPGLNIAWALTKSLYGNATELRQKKLLEWLEMVKDNPAIFTEQLLETEEFQDAFVTSLEAYIKQRNADKRTILRAIFIDYSAAEDPVIYPLERFNDITKQISIFDAKNFSYLVKQEDEIGRGVPFQDDRQSIEHIESVLHLISLGLLIRDAAPVLPNEPPMVTPPHIYISELGIQYYEFVKQLKYTSNNRKQP